MSEYRFIHSASSQAEQEMPLTVLGGLEAFLYKGTNTGPERDVVLGAVNDALQPVLITIPNAFEEILFGYRDQKVAIDAKPEELTAAEKAFIERFAQIAQFAKKLRLNRGNLTMREALREELRQLIPLQMSEGKRSRDQARRQRKKNS